jgi:hypothetical protein
MFIPLLLLGIGWYLASSGLGLDKACDGLMLVMEDQKWPLYYAQAFFFCAASVGWFVEQHFLVEAWIKRPCQLRRLLRSLGLMPLAL